MKKVARVIIKILLVLVGLPTLYILVSLFLTIIPVAEKETSEPKIHTIYLTTNGVHAVLVLPKELIDPAILKDQIFKPTDGYFDFGWGEENFYINTPTWGDLTFSTAFCAAFFKE